MHFSTIIAGALAAVAVTAHPGHDHHQEMEERRAMLQHTRRDLGHCMAKMKARGLEGRSLKRRSTKTTNLTKNRGLKERDLTSLLNVSHESTESYSLSTPETTIFASNNSCVLSPEVTEGPYYVSGEYIRQNIVESQEGVPMTIELQVLDVETCEPVDGELLEIWHCNSTGVYSGVSASGNGASDTDTSNLNATFLRGVQETDSDGVAQFETLFPGHYTGRTTHIHVMLHMNATAQANGTLLDTTASHVGQVFFDQDLITSVEATEIYATNTQELTTNADDGILSEEAASSDPFVQYVLLGDSIEDGLLAWLAFGVNTTLSKSVSAAATLYDTGGQANANAGVVGGPGGGSPPSGFPSSTAVPTSA
ncbi:Catechol 1,2-dioxygenase 1 [Pleurostoma richardsiae]|uniref:Catechol 1,2-dioxygenase 1 n=1 Tax=Pleurostoma richardsiae TaxID=41990 RepID=A0AA38RC44_9PEZI|nr:Catechol 1,2-dioxygenase 1 [Pleurostoma richardsiae]